MGKRIVKLHIYVSKSPNLFHEENETYEETIQNSAAFKIAMELMIESVNILEKDKFEAELDELRLLSLYIVLIEIERSF